jgi:arylsulfatase
MLPVFTADHGDMPGDHNMWRKTFACESTARITGIFGIRHPLDPIE